MYLFLSSRDKICLEYLRTSSCCYLQELHLVGTPHLLVTPHRASSASMSNHKKRISEPCMWWWKQDFKLMSQEGEWKQYCVIALTLGTKWLIIIRRLNIWNKKINVEIWIMDMFEELYPPQRQAKIKGEIYQTHYWEFIEICSVGSDVGRFLPPADP